jgi:predicted PurR-regulated permease PerM
MKEKYFKYSLILLIAALGVLIAFNLWVFVNGLLGAFTVYILVRNQMIYLCEKRNLYKPIAATLVLLEVAGLVFIPLFLIVWTLIGNITEINIDVTELIASIKDFLALLQQKTGYNVLSSGNIETATNFLTKGLQMFISQISGIFVSAIVIIFILYFMLINRKYIESYFYDMLPFNEDNKHGVLKEIHKIVSSNAIGIPLIAMIQSVIACSAYLVAGAPSPFTLGLLTGFATIIPLLGTGLVWFPLCVYMALTGNWIAALGLLAFCVLILTNVDNVIRFILQKKMSNIHPLITVFGVILGLKVFGFWGIIFGPLILSMFFFLVNIFKKEYLDKDSV